MSVENISVNCDDKLGSNIVNERISVYEAKQRYENQLCETESERVKGFTVDLNELKSFISDVEGLEKTTAVRIWKARRRVVSSCVQPDGTTIDSPPFYVEDLVFMPVTEDGKDYYSKDGTGNFTVGAKDSEDVILASPRPCPEWCRVRKAKSIDFFQNRYFFQRTDGDLGGVIRSTEPIAVAVLNRDLYEGKGEC